MANNVARDVKGFVVVAFLLLGALFGMQIMNFIFVQLGPNSLVFIDNTNTQTNETGVYINETVFTISAASSSIFNGGFTVIQATNSSSGIVIPASNYTVDAKAGTITNATVTVYPSVNLTYTYNDKSSAELSSEEIQNNSLQGIVTYTEQSSTQFSTVSIAITLIILVAVFLVFWRIFVVSKKKKEKKGANMGGNFGE